MLVLLFTMGVVNAFPQTESVDSQSYMEQHIAIVNMKARAVSKTEYVVEIKLKDYSGVSGLPVGFGSEEKVYADDGREYDLVKGDGVFTSKQKYLFTAERSTAFESNVVLYDPNFQHKTQLENDPEIQNRIISTCKFIKVGCPPSTGGNCPACRWWGWSCWLFLPCATGLEW